MNVTSTLHRYRGHPVAITKITSHAGDYYTQTNETVAAMMADVASDDHKNDDAEICQRTYATEAGAKAGAAAEIEDAIGAAEANEIEEALADILGYADRDDLQKLRDALASYTKENGEAGGAQGAFNALRKAATPRTT